MVKVTGRISCLYFNVRTSDIMSLGVQVADSEGKKRTQNRIFEYRLQKPMLRNKKTLTCT